MLSRPSEKRIVAWALLAAKACSPRRNWKLSLPEEHAFAASMSKQQDSSLEGRESMAPSSQPRADDFVTERVLILLVALKNQYDVCQASRSRQRNHGSLTRSLTRLGSPSFPTYSSQPPDWLQ